MSTPNNPAPGTPPGDAPPDEAEVSQPLVTHLTELRDRLLRALLAVLLVFLAMYPFANELYAWLSEPLRALMPAGSTMIATEVASPFLAPFKLTLLAALCAAMPIVLYQVWMFVAPGLYLHEKKIATPLLISSIVLFYLGLAFAYFVVFPLVFGFFTSVGPENIAVMTDISRYLDFVIKLFLAFGVAFEIPVATVLLISMGVIDSRSMAEKRPYIIIGCFTIGMLMTPPDIISQVLLAVPMWLLFETGLFFGRFVEADEPGNGASA